MILLKIFLLPIAFTVSFVKDVKSKHYNRKLRKQGRVTQRNPYTDKW